MKREQTRANENNPKHAQQKNPAQPQDDCDPRQKAPEEKQPCDTKDCVEEASEESFPASDSPSWTPTKST